MSADRGETALGTRADPSSELDLEASAELSRTISEVVAPGGAGARPPWMLGALGLALVGVLALLWAPPSDSSAAAGASERRRLRPPPRQIAPLPEVNVSSQPGAGVEIAPVVPVDPAIARQALAEVRARRKRAAERLRSPIVIYDEVSPVSPPSHLSRSERGARPAAPDLRLGAAGGARSLVREDAASGGGSTFIAEGSLIRAVLETAIQSDLPGRVRAQVAEPVRSQDGRLVAPAGSRLVGKYDAGIVRGQTRVFVIWSRLLLPDGRAIALESPGTDALGRAGLGASVDAHFLEIFGASLVLSLLDGGIEIAKARAQDSDGSTIVSSGGSDFSRAAEIALRNRIDIVPTLRVPAGTEIQVFVAKDIDVSGAMTRTGTW